MRSEEISEGLNAITSDCFPISHCWPRLPHSFRVTLSLVSIYQTGFSRQNHVPLVLFLKHYFRLTLLLKEKEQQFLEHAPREYTRPNVSHLCAVGASC